MTDYHLALNAKDKGWMWIRKSHSYDKPWEGICGGSHGVGHGTAQNIAGASRLLGFFHQEVYYVHPNVTGPS